MTTKESGVIETPVTSQANAANKILGIGEFDTERFKLMESRWYTFVGGRMYDSDGEYVRARRDFEEAYNLGYTDAPNTAAATSQTVQTDGLLNCPFCGGKGERYKNIVGCQKCDAWLDTAEEWNTRTAAATEQRLAAYTDALDLALAVIEDYEQWLPRTSTNRDVKEANRQRIQKALAQQPSQRERTADFIKELRSGGKVTSDDLSIVINARPSQSEVSDD